MQLVDAAAPLDFRVDEVQHVGDRTVILGRLLKGNHLVRRQLFDLFLRVGDVAPVVVEPVEFIVLEDLQHARQEVGAPPGTGWRAAWQIPPVADPVTGARPLGLVVRIMPGEIAARGIRQNLDSALVDHRHEASESLRIDGRQLVAAEESIAIVPFIHHVDQLDSLVLQPIQFLFVVLVRRPRFAAGVLPQVIDALARQIVGDEVFPHARADLLGADGDVHEPPPVVVGAVAGQNRRRTGRRCSDLRRGGCTPLRSTTRDGNSRGGRSARLEECSSVHIRFLITWPSPVRYDTGRPGNSRQQQVRSLNYDNSRVLACLPVAAHFGRAPVRRVPGADSAHHACLPGPASIHFCSLASHTWAVTPGGSVTDSSIRASFSCHSTCTAPRTDR